MPVEVKRKRLRHILRRRKTTIGAAPGLLNADPTALPTHLDVVGYSLDAIAEKRLSSVDEIDAMRERWPLVWVNVTGLQDVASIERIGQAFGLHRLALEDVLSVHQRPKLEEYSDHFFVVLRMLRAEGTSEQISVFFGAGFVITFQEREGDCFEPVRHRLRQGSPRIRGGGSDYLAYALVDAVVDAYFPALEQLGDKLDRVETTVLERPIPGVVREVAEVKHELLALRRAVWPLREAVSALQRQESALVAAETRIYLRDCYDHTVQLIDLIESYRELAGGLLDSYMTGVSFRTGEITKVLTIIATVFIPLTFVAGIYGMNFDSSKSPYNMPELGWKWGYPAALGLMALITVLLVIYFRRKGWIGDGPKT